MTLSEWAPALALGIDWSIRLAALWWIPSRASSSEAARSWLLLVGFVPFLGLPLYLLFGHPWLTRERVERQKQVSRQIRQEEALQKDLRWQAPAGSMASNVTPLVEKLGDFMPVSGNSVELLDKYAESIQALVDAIDNAKGKVHLLYYLMFEDSMAETVVCALERAKQRGVVCRVLLDAVGAKRALRAYRKRLITAGVEVHAMLPGGLRWRRNSRVDLRNHRKIAVIDNTVSFVGSQNLANPDFVAGYPNREVVARVRGPALTQLDTVFASDWYLETGEELSIVLTQATQPENTCAQLLPSGPAYPYPNARDTIIFLIHQAKQRIVLTTPYFIPDEATINSMRTAALSGIEVQLILSWSSNQHLTAWAQKAYYEELLSCGIRIALYKPHFLHAKHISIDNEIAMVGSINLDMRSFALNAEIGFLCYDEKVVRRLHGIEDDYLCHAEILTLESLYQQPAWKHNVACIARLADSFL